ncbi:5-(carboxyamino)imidazole ribonucleotide synthase [bacterium]|nr:5-(carboxyamino)imidazole ribonucleotide synthase [bacterium]
MLKPGGTIGILGGGQLGRMSAMAAARMGYHCHIYSPQADEPAFEVARFGTAAAYDDHEALQRFAESVDLITLEFENIPADTVGFLANLRPMRPGWRLLHISQHRLREKQFFQSLNIATAPFAEVNNLPILLEALKTIGTPAILKSSESGYDGKGQATIKHITEAEEAWNTIGQRHAILEGMVKFEREISAIVARNRHETKCFPIAHNIHRHHILHQSIVPAGIPDHVEKRAQEIALTIADAVELEGILAVEMFVTETGDILVNEMAPRPHNSGHWTLDACVTSQFEQHIRAVCNLPLGDVSILRPARMTNLLGDNINEWETWLKNPSAKWHLYGKHEAKPSRKMGHVTELL